MVHAYSILFTDCFRLSHLLSFRGSEKRVIIFSFQKGVRIKSGIREREWEELGCRPDIFLISLWISVRASHASANSLLQHPRSRAWRVDHPHGHSNGIQVLFCHCLLAVSFVCARFFKRYRVLCWSTIFSL